MKKKDEKVYVGIPVPLIVIIVIFLEIFAESGIKRYDVKKDQPIFGMLCLC